MKYRIQRFKETLTIAADGTTITSGAHELNGLLRGILLDVPDLVGTTTLQIDILDVDSQTIYTKSTIAENAKTPIFLDAQNNPLNLPLSGNHTVKLTASNAQTSQAANISYVLLIER